MLAQILLVIFNRHPREHGPFKHWLRETALRETYREEFPIVLEEVADVGVWCLVLLTAGEDRREDFRWKFVLFAVEVKFNNLSRTLVAALF